MIILHEVKDVLQFEPYLIEIIVDAPERNIHLKLPFNTAINALRAAGREGGVRINTNNRVCRSSCECNSYYDSISYPILRQKFALNCYPLKTQPPQLIKHQIPLPNRHFIYISINCIAPFQHYGTPIKDVILVFHPHPGDISL